VLGVHVGAEDGVDAGLVAGVLAEPAEQVGVEVHGHDGFGGGVTILASFQNAASVRWASGFAQRRRRTAASRLDLVFVPGVSMKECLDFDSGEPSA